MKEKIKGFVVLFIIQVISYTLLCINFRAVARAEYFLSAISDFMIASLSFFVIKKIAKDEGKSIWLWLGYSLGGVVGSILGIYLSKILLNG